MSLNERTQQFGILSSVGATAKQLRNSVLFEGFCIGMIGIPIGIAVGIISKMCIRDSAFSALPAQQLSFPVKLIYVLYISALRVIRTAIEIFSCIGSLFCDTKYKPFPTAGTY